jgi:1,4-dihydroxy-2-naphthoyl-CoA hydrolase
MSFTYVRTIRFQDTDAAGVVYFANVLPMCHEAYEESIAAVGIQLQAFFGSNAVAIPIVHASVDLFQPMFCGDRQLIHLTPQRLDNHKFEIAYEILKQGSDTPRCQSNHPPCLHRSRQPNPPGTASHHDSMAASLAGYRRLIASGGLLLSSFTHKEAG